MASKPETDYLSVTQINNYISSLLTNDINLNHIWIKGEISGFKYYQQSGHMYFTIKDEYSMLSSVMFKRYNQALDFMPEDGAEVIIRGSIKVFEKQGRYQLYAEEAHLFGQGNLYFLLEALKKKLQSEGIFAAEHKQAIPADAQKIGIVSSQSGAAVRDMRKILLDRSPGVEIIIAHASVQGDAAPAEIAHAIELLNRYADLDLIIVGRGGGSFEDLMPFNSEAVVRAVYSSKLPIISAVGHEVDFTLCDLAADLRAATPTEAAQLAVPERRNQTRELHKQSLTLQQHMTRHLEDAQETYDRIIISPPWQMPAKMLQRADEHLHHSTHILTKNLQHRFADIKASCMLSIEMLDKLSPLKVLARGYSILEKTFVSLPTTVNSIEAVELGEELAARLVDGDLTLYVTHKEHKQREKL